MNTITIMVDNNTPATPIVLHKTIFTTMFTTTPTYGFQKSCSHIPAASL